MLEKIKHWLEPPIFPGDEEKNAQARLIHTMGLYFVLALIISAVVYVPLFATRKIESWTIILALFIFYGISRFFMFRGQLAFASLFMISAGWIVCEGLAITGGGVNSPAMFALVAITMAVGLLYEPRTGSIFLFLSILVGLGMAIAQQNGIALPKFFEYSPLSFWFYSSLSMLFLNWTVNLTVRRLERALTLAQQQNEAREKAESTLRQSEEKYRLLFDHAGDAIFIHDEQGRMLAVNSLALERYGYTREELMALTIDQVDAPEEGRYASERIATLMRQGHHAFETVHQRKNRSLIPVDVSAQRVFWDGIPAMMSICRDITARKQTEEALHKSEEKYRTVANFTYDWESWHGPDGACLYVSPSCERITGHTVEEFTNIPDLVAQITHPDDKQKITEHLDAVAHQAQEDDVNLEFRIVTPQGETRWIEHSCVAAHGKEGQWLGRRESNRDITQRKQAEEALRNSEAQLKTITENTPDTILWVDQKGLITFINRLMPGLTMEEVIGSSIYRWVPNEQHPVLARTFEAVFTTGERGEYVSLGPGPNGEQRTYHVRVMPITIDNKTTSAIYTATDITARKQAEEALRANQEETQAIIDAVPDLMFDVDREGCFFNYHAPEHEGLYAPPEVFMGKTISDILPAPVAEVIMGALADADLHSWHRGATFALEIASGRHWYELSIQAKSGTSDSKKRFIVLARDITERKRAEEAMRSTNAKLETLIRVSPLAITLLDTSGNVQLWNPAAEQIFGWTAQEMIGHPNPIVPTNKQNEYVTLSNQILHGKILSGFETVRQGKDGSPIDVSISSAPINDEDGTVAGRMAIVTDISERKKMEHSLVLRNQEMERLYETSLEINALSEISALLNSIIQQACALLHVPYGALHLVNSTDGLLETVVVHQLPPLWIGTKIRSDEGLAGQVIRTKKPATVEDYQTWEGRLDTFPDSPAHRALGIPLKIRNEVTGVLMLIDQTVGSFSDEEIRLISLFAGQAAIALENARLYEEVQKLAVTDALTGIFNRTFFETELARFEPSRGFPMSIIVADLDNMKTTNDKRGHAIGDELLKSVASVLRDTFRAEDILARIGGDEFAILLPGTDSATTVQMLSRVQAKLAEHNAKHPDLPIQLSLGSATAEQGKLTEAFILADQRMYKEKAIRKSKPANRIS